MNKKCEICGAEIGLLPCDGKVLCRDCIEKMIEADGYIREYCRRNEGVFLLEGMNADTCAGCAYKTVCKAWKTISNRED